MSKSVLHWEDSLDQYLRLSNEDDRIVEFFGSKLVGIVTRVNESDRINWLDVGTGPGSKTCRFAERLAMAVGRQRIDLTMLDPQFSSNESLTTRLLIDIGIHVDKVAIEPVTLEEFVSRSSDCTVKRIGVLSAVHFFYSAALISPFVRLIDRASNTLLVLFLVCESSTSDFHRMRAQLLANGIEAPRSVLSNVVRVLRARGLSVQQFTIDGQRCRIDRERLMRDDDYWLFPFLVARSTHGFLGADRIREAVCRITREYVSTLSSDELSVPDTAIIAHSRIGNSV